MFTGIIEHQLRVQSFTGERLSLELPLDWKDELRIGESIAINGCCLTLVKSHPFMEFDVSKETLTKTALGRLNNGDGVNIERAMAIGGRFGGHIVQGHVDTTGTFLGLQGTENAHVLRFLAPKPWGRYVVEKGSIAIQGISLTVVSPQDFNRGTEFEVWVIPHTWTETNLHQLKPGDCVNLELDMIAKYVERLLAKN